MNIDGAYDYGWKVSDGVKAEGDSLKLLTEQTIINAIRKNGGVMTMAQLAQVFGVSKNVMDDVVMNLYHNDKLIMDWEGLHVPADTPDKRGLYSSRQKKSYSGYGNNAILSGNWRSFCGALRWGELDLDTFAQAMGFDDMADLDLSITPRALYQRNPERFTSTVQSISPSFSDSNVLEAVNRKSLKGYGVGPQVVSGGYRGGGTSSDDDDEAWSLSDINPVSIQKLLKQAGARPRDLTDDLMDIEDEFTAWCKRKGAMSNWDYIEDAFQAWWKTAKSDYVGGKSLTLDDLVQAVADELKAAWPGGTIGRRYVGLYPSRMILVDGMTKKRIPGTPEFRTTQEARQWLIDNPIDGTDHLGSFWGTEDVKAWLTLANK